jgi:hypothetical protein
LFSSSIFNVDYSVNGKKGISGKGRRSINPYPLGMDSHTMCFKKLPFTTAVPAGQDRMQVIPA